jgi:hypothetical protein
MDCDLSDILSYLKVNQPGLFLEESEENDYVEDSINDHLDPITTLLLQGSPSLVNDLLNVLQRGNLTNLTKLQYVVDKLHQRFMALNAYDLNITNNFKAFVLKEATLLLSIKLDEYIDEDLCEIDAIKFKELYFNCDKSFIIKSRQKTSVIR